MALKLQLLKQKKLKNNLMILRTKSEIVNRYRSFQKWRENFRENVYERRQLVFRAFKAIKKGNKMDEIHFRDKITKIGK